MIAPISGSVALVVASTTAIPLFFFRAWLFDGIGLSAVTKADRSGAQYKARSRFEGCSVESPPFCRQKLDGQMSGHLVTYLLEQLQQAYEVFFQVCINAMIGSP